MKAIPFQVDLRTSTVQGVLRLGKAALAVEWRRFNLMGSPKGELEGIEIPYGDLEKVEYRKRLVGAKIEVFARSPSSFGRFPLPEGSITTLPAVIKHRHRGDAPGWAAEAGLRIAEGEDPALLE